MNARLGQGRRLFKIALKSTIGIALLGLPAMLASAQAQTEQGTVYSFQEHCAKARLADNPDVVAADPESFGAASKASVMERAQACNSASYQDVAFAGLNVFVKRATPRAGASSLLTYMPQSTAAQTEPSAVLGDRPADDSKSQLSNVTRVRSEPIDFNRSIYYKNKLEFSWEGGWLPNNIPFVFALFIGHQDKLSGLNYTLMPFIASIRWNMTNIGGPWIFRGSWDITFSGTFTLIPRGPETRYWAYLTGFRRNFIQPNWRIVPYLEGRAGLGNINAKAPFAAKSLPEENRGQGQDFAFTVMLGGGVRYNLSPRYAVSAGLAYTHISNLYLSEPKFLDEGINVYGPMFGINIRLGKPRR